MAKRILVPLERAAGAELLLDLVGDLARGSGAHVRLLHVRPLPDTVLDENDRVLAYADQEMSRLEAEALDDLRTLEPRLAGIAVDSVVRFGDAFEEIVKEAAAFGAELVVLITRSRGPLARAVLGSVAEHVFRKIEADVMLYRPAASRAA
jgi:nucleotide-binding universal stress UspA family protein